MTSSNIAGQTRSPTNVTYSAILGDIIHFTYVNPLPDWRLTCMLFWFSNNSRAKTVSATMANRHLQNNNAEHWS
jgi:hypothetical protein